MHGRFFFGLALIALLWTGCGTVFHYITDPAPPTKPDVHREAVSAYDYRPGQRVRLVLSDVPTPITGTVTEVDQMRVIVASPSVPRLELARHRVKQAWLSHGQRNSAWEEAVGQAMIAGAMAGVLGWALAKEGDVGRFDSDIAVGLRWGGVVGLGFGTLTAASYTAEPPDQWKPMPKVMITVPLE
jgi:hypothetical protein